MLIKSILSASDLTKSMLWSIEFLFSTESGYALRFWKRASWVLSLIQLSVYKPLYIRLPILSNTHWLVFQEIKIKLMQWPTNIRTLYANCARFANTLSVCHPLPQCNYEQRDISTFVHTQYSYVPIRNMNMDTITVMMPYRFNNTAVVQLPNDAIETLQNFSRPLFCIRELSHNYIYIYKQCTVGKPMLAAYRYLPHKLRYVPLIRTKYWNMVGI